MKVYLAAPYSMKDVITLRANDLRAAGMNVTSRWLEEPHSSSTQLNDVSSTERTKYAQQDVDDICDCDVFVFQDGPQPRVGRVVEFGIAVAINKLVRPMPIFVVGEDRANIFHHLPQVKHFATWAETKQALWDAAAPDRAGYDFTDVGPIQIL